MTWEKVRLQDIAMDIQTGPFGSQLHQSDYVENGTPVVMPKDLMNGAIVQDTIARVDDFHVEQLSRHKVQAGDILFSRRGDVGRCAYVQEHEEGWLCGTGCLRARLDKKRAAPRFVFYCLQRGETVNWLENHAVGSTMLNLNTTIVGDIPLVLPPYGIQQKIADILSSYDYLIANQQQQIKLLEEAAQRLYKEWFVDLHFPGWEKADVADWKRVSIDDVCETVGGGTPSTKVDSYYRDGKILWVTPTDITRNISLYVEDTEKKINEEGLAKSSAKMVPPYTILMTSRASVGYFGICDKEVCTNQGFISCIPKRENFRMYLLFNLMNRVEEIRGKAGGSTYLEISKKNFRDLQIMIPCDELLARFEEVAGNMVKSIENATRSIHRLQEARDRLLPKLISGEIEVSS